MNTTNTPVENIERAFAVVYKKELEHCIQSALCEDLGNGDHTTLACVDPRQEDSA